MDWKKMLLVLGMCSALLAGCGREKPSDREQIEDDLLGNEFFKALGATPKNRLPSVGKGDTLRPDTCWRIINRDTVWYDIDVGPGEATVPVHIRWSDTLVCVYGVDTVYKPAPYYSGEVTFHYKVIDNKWKFYGLTPGEIKSDAADGYVQIDSIQIHSKEQGHLPSITGLTQFIPAEDYPYIFSTGDSITITVYKGGILSDTIAWVLLHAPLLDYVSPFEFVTTGIWKGTWVPKAPQAHWGWVDVYDIGALIYTDQLTERAILWGIPYKVQ